MVLFFCSTPFQIMSALAIRENAYRDEHAKMYILDYFNDAEEYVEKLQNTKLFQEVKLLRVWKIYQRVYGTRAQNETKLINKLRHSIWRIYYYIRYEKILQEFGIDGEDIEKVLISYREPICLLLARNNYKRHLNIHFIGYEDGNSSYLGELDEVGGRIEKLFHIPEQVFKKEIYWVYRPDQIVSQGKYIDRIRRIEIDKIGNFSASIDNIWDKVSDDIVKTNFIYFDSLDNIKFLDQIVPELVRICGAENILFKKHPRRMDKYYENRGLNVWKVCSVPFEVALVKQNIENKVLICNYSTACLNAKFIFNQEPTIIFLFDLLEKDEEKKEINILISKLTSLYVNKSKIYIPNSIEELFDILRTMNENIRKIAQK